MIEEIQAELQRRGDPEKAAGLQRYFKTGPGEYGEGDRFHGVRVPELRQLTRQFQALPLDEVTALLHSPFHEERMLALLILVRHFGKGDEAARRRIFDLYLANTAWINNWDLVDCSAEHIVGAFLWDRPRALLDQLARSALLWERRIAIMSTFHFIRRSQFGDTLRLAETLLADPHDLIHKAVGWMVREVGERDRAAEETFLRAHAPQMPRTMLRYAIEKFPEPLRQSYLKR